MKKHPIDDLFARKLSDWEPEASPDLWNRIEATKKKSSRKVAGWYWYAAAGIVLAVMAGYLVWQGQNSTLTPSNTTIAKRDSSPVTPENLGPADSEKPEEVFVATIGAPVATELTSRGAATPPETDPEVPESNKAAMYVATVELEDLQPLQKEEYSPMTLELSKESLPAVVPTEIALGSREESRSKDRVIVAHIPFTESASGEETMKSSKFIRVLRQLKNAKEGEAVDWNEVGFNPKKLIARADERLKNEEEKVSKYYQNLKEKTKL